MLNYQVVIQSILLFTTTALLQTGLVKCEQSQNWPVVPNTNLTDPRVFKESYQQVTFAQPYDDVPTVFLSTGLLAADKDYNIRYYMRVKDVTKSSLTITCGIWADTIVYRLHVNWISFSKPKC